jgi:hypothetical protein
MLLEHRFDFAPVNLHDDGNSHTDEHLGNLSTGCMDFAGDCLHYRSVGNLVSP